MVGGGFFICFLLSLSESVLGTQPTVSPSPVLHRLELVLVLRLLRRGAAARGLLGLARTVSHILVLNYLCLNSTLWGHCLHWTNFCLTGGEK
jgi:hypothetical protein